MLNEKVGFITLVSSFRTCGYLKHMPRAQPLTLAREFKFQAMNFLLPSFARYTAAKQNMRTNGLVYHMLTLLQKQADKNSRDYSNYLRVRLGARVSCAATILTKKKSLLSNITIKIDHHLEPKFMLCTHHHCFGSFVISLRNGCHFVQVCF